MQALSTAHALRAVEHVVDHHDVRGRGRAGQVRHQVREDLEAELLRGRPDLQRLLGTQRLSTPVARRESTFQRTLIAAAVRLSLPTGPQVLFAAHLAQLRAVDDLVARRVALGQRMHLWCSAAPPGADDSLGSAEWVGG
jgi:hypothetical protein